MQRRQEQLQAEGYSLHMAWRIAVLESRIAEWPSEWGGDLLVLLYGDFEPAAEPLHFKELGISVDAGQVAGTILQHAGCVTRARVTVKERTIAGLNEASKRLNGLLAAMTALGWANSGCGWWGHITHPSIAGTVNHFDRDKIDAITKRLNRLPGPLKQQVEAALDWIREPVPLFSNKCRSETFRVYSGLWNAFECLVEAVCLENPVPKPGRRDKKARREADEREIEAFIAQKQGRLSAEDCTTSTGRTWIRASRLRQAML